MVIASLSLQKIENPIVSLQKNAKIFYELTGDILDTFIIRTLH
jgi:hypothetical protein